MKPDVATITKLQKLNIRMAIIHAISFLGIVIWYGVLTPSARTLAKQQVTRNQIPGPGEDADSNAPGKCNVNVNYASPKHMGSLNLIALVLVFFAITVAAHVWYAYSPTYLIELHKGWNPYRWLEYALSASIMSAIVGITSGIRDISQLQELVLLTAGMQGCGWIVERALQKNDFSTVNVATGIGWLLFVALWFSILWNFFFLLTDVNTKYKNIDDANGKPIKVPGFVFFIVFFQLLQFASFGVVQMYHVLQAKKGPVNYASKIEPLYVNLSAIAKVGLASGIGYGFLLRANGC